jgi:hypothetical protein
VQVHPKEEAPSCGAFAEPSDGLEPSTLLTMEDSVSVGGSENRDSI